MQAVETSAAHEALIQFLYRAPVGLVQTDACGQIEMINPIAAQLLMPIAVGGSLDNLFVLLGGMASELATTLRAYKDDEAWTHTVRVSVPSHDGGTPLILAVHLSRLAVDSCMAVLQDISLQVAQEQRRLDRRLHRAARLDTLTQLANQTELRECIARVQATAAGPAHGGCALLLLNGDRFRRINDRLGAAVGDQLLVLVAGRLRNMLRAGEVEVARMGGDEFAVLLRNLSGADEALAVGTRVADALRQPYTVDSHTLTCSFSAGLVLDVQNQGDVDGLLRDASVAMIAAKHQRDGRLVVFEQGMRERAIQRGRVEAELRIALAEGQLFVVYQPIVALEAAREAALEAARGPRCVGVEALVRWRHPTRGVVPPGEFIAVAEECGLIGAVGEFVLVEAVRQLGHWQQVLGDRAPHSVSVNLSRLQLQQSDLVAWLDGVLCTSGLPPACLQLEVTESLAAEDAEVQATLRRIKALGVTLALDDFGTGYSSLACLHQFPVDVLKIDRSFTAQVNSSQHHAVLVQATVLVARSLSMSTVVEGIETEAQARIVRELGCDKGQGYYFSRPMEAPALQQWMAAAA